MGTSLSTSGRHAHLTIAQAAHALAVPTSTVHRAIRVGTLRLVRRRSQLVIPVRDITNLLGGAR